MEEAVQEVNTMARGRNWIVACFSWETSVTAIRPVGRCRWHHGLLWCRSSRSHGAVAGRCRLGGFERLLLAKLELLAWIGHDVSTNWSWIVVDLVEKGRKDLLICSGGWGMSYCHLSISVADRERKDEKGQSGAAWR